ncbi:hypothetical protein B296_00043397, partial [Ensete ventricosum]
GWGSSLKWTCRDIDNSPPFLSKEEAEQVMHLRGILSSSKAIKSMSEDWLVEASLRPLGVWLIWSSPLVGLLFFFLSSVSGQMLMGNIFIGMNLTPTVRPITTDETERPSKKMKVLVHKPPSSATLDALLQLSSTRRPLPQLPPAKKLPLNCPPQRCSFKSSARGSNKH